MPGPGLDVFGEEELREVMDALKSREMSRYRFDDIDGVAPPSKTYSFEREFETFLGVNHALGCNSCTTALLTGLWASGIGPGDEVLVPGYTFVASIAAIVYSGATPVLVEIDESFCIDPEDVRRKITRKTRGIMVVHMLGAPSDMAKLKAICDQYELMIFEDCAQAGGASFNGQALGSFGNFGAFSLNVFKTFTAGDGGVLTTNDHELYQNAFAIHDHGSAPMRIGVNDNHSYLGLNFRMHEMTGALALVQLRKLQGNLERLRANKEKLLAAIGPLPSVRRRKLNDSQGECATVLVYIFESHNIAQRLADKLGVVTLSHSGKHNYANIPQLQKPAKFASQDIHFKFNPGSLPKTDDILDRSLALSVGVSDSYLGSGFGIKLHSHDDQIKQVANTFRVAFEEAVAETET